MECIGSDSCAEQVAARPEPAARIKEEPEAAAAAVATQGVPKCEQRVCVACGASVDEWLEAAGALAELLARLLGGSGSGGGGAACRACAALLGELKRAEAEYRRLKQEFDAIIARNPLHRGPPAPAPAPAPCEPSEPGQPPSLLHEVKSEAYESDYLPDLDLHSDSEDEPLASKRTRVAQTKKKKTKKKGASGNKKRKSQKIKSLDSYEDDFALDNYCTVKQEIDISKEDYKDDIVLKVELGEAENAEEPPRRRRGRPAGAGRGAGRGAARAGTGAKPKKEMFSCGQCRAKYSSAERLARHSAAHAPGAGPPYICEVCGASYKHRRACEIHVALHKGISKWKCEECNRLFPSKGALERHNNIHTGKLNYQCDLCGKSFIHTSSFKMHKLAHSGLKPHACAVCGLALMTSSHLKRHMRIHSGEKRYECEHCGRRFSERYNLAAHARSHTQRAQAPAEPAGAGGAAAGGAGGAGGAPRAFGFRCPYCPERCGRKYLLERHVASAHGRALERSPARPRNTMSKMLKAQAARPTQDAATPSDAASPEQKTVTSPAPAQRDERLKHAQTGLGGVGGAGAAGAVGAAGGGVSVPGSWGGGFVAEFSRLHYPH